MTIDSYLSFDEIKEIGFKSIGDRCKISRHCSIYNADSITIGADVRIDDFCIISSADNGEILIGNNVHISPYCLLSGRSTIQIGDFVNISSRVAIYSSSDDFSGEEFPGPQSQLHEYNPYESSPVTISSFSIVGTGTVLLPGAHLEEGSAVGALSLVKGNVPSFAIYAGIPAKYIRARNKTFLNYLNG